MRLLRMACRSGNREQILLAITPIVIDDLIDRLTATPRHERDSLRLKDGFPSCRGDGDLG